MTPIELNNQFGVAVLALIGSLVLRRFGLSDRLNALTPTILCVLIFWLFVDLPDTASTLLHGIVSGLLASGLAYILLGLTGRR